MWPILWQNELLQHVRNVFPELFHKVFQEKVLLFGFGLLKILTLIDLNSYLSWKFCAPLLRWASSGARPMLRLTNVPYGTFATVHTDGKQRFRIRKGKFKNIPIAVWSWWLCHCFRLFSHLKGKGAVLKWLMGHNPSVWLYHTQYSWSKSRII